MLGLPSSVRIYLATEPTDMRKGIDSLAALVRRWGGNPFSGHLFVFMSRRRDRARILTWDRGGYVFSGKWTDVITALGASEEKR